MGPQAWPLPTPGGGRGNNVHSLEGTGLWGRKAGPLTHGRPRSQTAEAAASCLGAAGQRPALSAQNSECAGSRASSASVESAAGPAGGQEEGGRWPGSCPSRLWSARLDHQEDLPPWGEPGQQCGDHSYAYTRPGFLGQGAKA